MNTTRYTLAELEAMLPRLQGKVGQKARIEEMKLAIARLKAEAANG